MGTYIASKTAIKVTEINSSYSSYLLGAIAGWPVDFKFLGRHLDFEVNYINYEYIISLYSWISQYRGSGLSMGTMICGYEGDEQKIYLVELVEDDGTRL